MYWHALFHGLLGYNRYYEITKDEYDSFGSVQLDELAESLYHEETLSTRFLYSDKNEENNSEQLKLREKAKG